MEGKYPERKAAGFGHDPETTVVREVMVKKAYYCFENQSVDEAREIMREYHLEYLPIVDDNLRVIGTVALRDLAAERNDGINKLDGTTSELLAAQSGSRR